MISLGSGKLSCERGEDGRITPYDMAIFVRLSLVQGLSCLLVSQHGR